VSLEHFKKQVLLLHSEQSTLDNLSSGFNDRYTVHCATSGTEALNTLGETQIDVIVTAQELPGMSGLDALREAKKRSPDTIGILLAGSEDDGLEALVGDQEVFQIVRGNVTSDSLKNLIDNATRQARLLALAESANDTTANPDEPVSEHIVMETSENGSTIISNDTGRMPILDPKKIPPSADVGSRAVDVLVLTKDEEFLATVQESARGLHNVIYANTLAQADDAVRKQKVGVAVIDAAMVGSNVEKLTMHLRAAAPRLVAIVAGRRDDGEMLMDLINRGKVYRFLLKPVSPGRSRLAVEASVKHHLEAPDSAFRVTGKTPSPMAEIKPPPKVQPKPKPAPKAAPKSAPKSAPEANQKKQDPPKPAPVAKAPKAPPAVPKARIGAKATIVPNPQEALSPIDDGLSQAFDGDDSSFSETVTGIVGTVASSFSSKKATSAEPETATAAAGSGGSLLSNRKVLGMGAAALVVIAGVSFWMFSGSDEPVIDAEPLSATPSISESDLILETEVVTPEALDVDELIDEAQLAATAGRVFTPPGSNAIELYLSALEVVPGDPNAEAGLQEVIDQALGMAESAMLERRAEDATTALQRVEQASPDNPRLPFLNAQLAQLHFRDYVDDARLAIRESRFEDASLAIDSARALAVADATEIDVVADDLRVARSEQRVDEVLARANARLEDGMLIAPSSDNARFYYELALSNDPGNTAARQGLTIVASKLVLQARAQIDAGNFDAADTLLVDARRLDPDSSELAESTDALNAARDRVAQEARRAAEQRAAALQAAADRAAAEKAAAEQAAAERAAAEQAAAERAAAEQAAAEQLAAAPASDGADEAAVAESQASDEEASAGDTETQTADDLLAERSGEGLPEATATQGQAALPEPMSAPVALSSLKRIRYVPPKYPRAAQRRNLSGWVDVVFTVNIDGTVGDVFARDSKPGDTFVKSATSAVENWEFEPVIENGVAVRKRASVRMMFAIN
jgi:serine/threonine-protein kinase